MSDDLQPRLMRCFQAVFPALSAEAAAAARQDSVEGWDSLASVTLLRLIEEEFGVEIDMFELDGLQSFAQIRDYLASAMSQPGARP